MERKLVLQVVMIYVSVLLLLSGCSATKSFGYGMANGEAVEVEMAVGDGYDLRAGSDSFSVRKDGEEIFSGLFITGEGYEVNLQNVLAHPDQVKLLISGPEEAPTLYAFQYETEEGTETDFLLRVENSEYAIALVSFAPYGEAKSAFDRLSFERIS